MNSLNGVKSAICQDTNRCESITLNCGHAFGRPCMQGGLEEHNQINCHLCREQLSDDDIEIDKIPLQERVVTISKNTIKFISQTAYTFAHSIPSFLIGAAGGAAAVATAVVADEGYAEPRAALLGGGAVGVFIATQMRELTVSAYTGFASGIAAGLATCAFVGSSAAFSLGAVSVVGVAANYLARNH